MVGLSLRALENATDTLWQGKVGPKPGKPVRSMSLPMGTWPLYQTGPPTTSWGSSVRFLVRTISGSEGRGLGVSGSGAMEHLGGMMHGVQVNHRQGLPWTLSVLHKVTRHCITLDQTTAQLQKLSIYSIENLNPYQAKMYLSIYCSQRLVNFSLYHISNVTLLETIIWKLHWNNRLLVQSHNCAKPQPGEGFHMPVWNISSFKVHNCQSIYKISGSLWLILSVQCLLSKWVLILRM